MSGNRQYIIPAVAINERLSIYQKVLEAKLRQEKNVPST